MARLDHKKMLKNLLPSGKAYIGENLDKLIDALSKEFKRVDTLAIRLLTKEIPGGLVLQLQAWERIVGLSKSYTPNHFASQGSEERNRAVVGKLSSVGGQSEKYWLNYLKRTSKSDINFEFFKPMVTGFYAGDLLFDKSWSFAFQINEIAQEDLTIIKDNVEAFKQAHIAAIYKLKET